MSDIEVTLSPSGVYDLVSDDASSHIYGEMNYIFYPGYSATYHLKLENTSTSNKGIGISFKAHDNDDTWWRTLRFIVDGSLVTSWSGSIAANSSTTLFILSKSTKEGFSGQYGASSWTNSGFTIANLSLINDGNETTAAIDCDAAAAGSTLTLDTGEDTEFRRIKFSANGQVDLKGTLQYSDDNITYTDIPMASGVDINSLDERYQDTYWWDSVGEHRYWRLEKDNAAGAGSDITEVQWLRFEAHKDAKDYGVYGDHKAYLTDASGIVDDFRLDTSIMVPVNTIARQNYQKPIGLIGKNTKVMDDNLQQHGQDVQIWYVPAITMSYTLNTKADFPLECRVWNSKAIVTPQKRVLQYTAAADGLAPSMYRYDQRNIYMPVYGPDYVGWYLADYDFWHAYGSSWYVLYDNHCYKVDDPQPVYYDNQIVAVTARMFLQSDMPNLTTDPRNYIVANSQGIFTQFPNTMPVLPSTYQDHSSPEQRPTRWIGAVPTYVYSRITACRPNTYSHGSSYSSDGYPNGEIYQTEDWLNPATATFTTGQPMAFGTRADATANAYYFQMDRFYNWIGYSEYTSQVDPFNFLLQVYADEDCLMPVSINLDTDAALTKVEHRFNRANTAANGKVTLTALGTECYMDGHLTPTPTKLYVRYIAEDNHIAYYYP